MGLFDFWKKKVPEDAGMPASYESHSSVVEDGVHEAASQGEIERHVEEATTEVSDGSLGAVETGE